MKIKLTDTAVKQLEKISKGDKKSAVRIISVIEKYAENPKSDFDIKKLKGKYGERLRLRVGDYRVIFKIDNLEMHISTIKHRQEAYND
jgi:addiction module RelE/StbE family toxin